MLIDCDACVMRGPECRDCVVSVVLGLHAERHQSLVIDDEELAALDALAESGLVPPCAWCTRWTTPSTTTTPRSTARPAATPRQRFP